jgi:hypothetical protein
VGNEYLPATIDSPWLERLAWREKETFLVDITLDD